jgi:hypothetical protein
MKNERALREERARSANLAARVTELERRLNELERRLHGDQGRAAYAAMPTYPVLPPQGARVRHGDLV